MLYEFFYIIFHMEQNVQTNSFGTSVVTLGKQHHLCVIEMFPVRVRFYLSIK